MSRLGLSCPGAGEILAATGSGRSRAYELVNRLERLVTDLVGSPGRPPAPPVEPAPAQLAEAVLDYVYAHPGCVSGNAQRNHYGDGFRRFVIDLLGRHPDVALEAAADAIRVPPGTLKDWQRGGVRDVDPARDPEMPPSLSPQRGLQIETVLAEWKHWDGTFTAFCDHLRRDCGVLFQRTAISGILEAHGARLRKRRPGRTPDELALRGTIETFFPHAQWVGDGTMLPVEVDGELHVFNLELDVDAYSGAFVGADVSPVEDSQAVIDTFRDAIAATGTSPVALLLDNKPSNHTDAVHEEMGDTILIPATPFRPQNKAHCEGGFGLLKPTFEGLELSGATPDELARSFLSALVTAVCRVFNRKPRKDRGGRSRADLLGDKPTVDEINLARQALEERLRRQQQARATLAARQNPMVRAILDAAYRRLGLDDPHGHLLTATARYPLDAVLEGIAIYEAKSRAGTLPPGVDARYLLGIVRNVADEREGWQISIALWDARVAARDQLALSLQEHRDQLAGVLHGPEHLATRFIDLALRTSSRIERFFWLSATADAIADGPAAHRRPLYRLASRRIHATHAVPHRDRVAANRFLAARVLPTS